MLKLRTIGLSDYSVLEGGQRIGRIRLATERMPCVWLWSVTVHLPGGLPIGSSKDLDTAKAEFKAAWEALKARTPPEQLAAAYKAMNIRDDGWSGYPHEKSPSGWTGLTFVMGLTLAATGLMLGINQRHILEILGGELVYVDR